MSAPSSFAALCARFAPIVGALRAAVARQAASFPALAPLLLVAWGRLGRLERRLAAVLARGGVAPRDRAGPRPSGSRGPSLPGGFAWLVRLVPEAACHAGQLRHWLGQPEVAAALAAAPDAGRVLRPLCRMLGVDPGPALPRRATTRREPDREHAPAQAARCGEPAPPAAARPRRSRVPRSLNRPWLRWRPANPAS